MKEVIYTAFFLGLFICVAMIIYFHLETNVHICTKNGERTIVTDRFDSLPKNIDYGKCEKYQMTNQEFRYLKQAQAK